MALLTKTPNAAATPSEKSTAVTMIVLFLCPEKPGEEGGAPPAIEKLSKGTVTSLGQIYQIA
ncbi:hypothetical protein GCM10023067_54840 [Aminobacter aganoensis]